MQQKVFIIGATGKVGREVVRQMYERGDVNRRKHKNPTLIVGLASSTGLMYRDEGISGHEATAFSTRAHPGRYTSLFDAATLLRCMKREPLHVIDVTASREMLQLHLEIIKDMPHTIVTANKNPLAYADFDTFQMLISQPQRYGYRCSVMAGAEAVEKIRDLRDLGNPPIRIEGCFSGTLGFLSTRIQEGQKLSVALAEAIRLGYTEPDPVGDLDGSDVAKKILILARTAGLKADLRDVKLKPFVPAEYLVEHDPQKLVQKVEELDDTVSSQMELARSAGKTLRYVASAVADGGKAKITVGQEEVLVNSPLGMLHGVNNKITITTKREPQPDPVEAKGAGVERTAENIRRDLLYQIGLERRLVS